MRPPKTHAPTITYGGSPRQIRRARTENYASASVADPNGASPASRRVAAHVEAMLVRRDREKGHEYAAWLACQKRGRLLCHCRSYIFRRAAVAADSHKSRHRRIAV
jgi:hypothetical protein